VLAHLPIRGVAEAGMGAKCCDLWAAHLCSDCHALADQGEYRNDIHWRSRMVYRTLERLVAQGHLR